MAAPYVESDPNKNARVLQALRAIREGRAILGQELAVAQKQIDGDTSQASQFDVWAAKRGIAANDYADANAAAKAGYGELASLYAILTKPSGQGDAAGAAIDQTCAIWGV